TEENSLDKALLGLKNLDNEINKELIRSDEQGNVPSNSRETEIEERETKKIIRDSEESIFEDNLIGKGLDNTDLQEKLKSAVMILANTTIEPFESSRFDQLIVKQKQKIANTDGENEDSTPSSNNTTKDER
ncbi:MAG: hypothetical protein ACXAEU_26285, partial [Candidatus Hodarchaeales archaeon]